LRSRKREGRRRPSIGVAHPHQKKEALPATRSDIRQSPPLPLLAATAGQRKKAKLSVSQSKEAVISPLIQRCGGLLRVTPLRSPEPEEEEEEP
jgi:hypothetical protein